MPVDILEIYDTQIRCGFDYCRICLRTESETRLVVPHYAKILTKYFNHLIFEGDNTKSVCYMCEASSIGAVRLYLAYLNAVGMKQLLKCLQTIPRGDPIPEHLQNAAMTCNVRLNKVRGETNLKQTEVLVVDSTGVVSEPVPPTRPIPVSAIAPLTTNTETVVIEDDDDVIMMTSPQDDDDITAQEKEIEQIYNNSLVQPKAAVNKQTRRQTKQQIRNNQILETGQLSIKKLTSQQLVAKQLAERQLAINQLVSLKKAQNKTPVLPKFVPIDIFLITKNEYIAARLPGEDKLIVRSPDDTENCVIHNIFVQNGKHYIPTLSSELRNNRLLYIPKLVVTPPSVLDPNLQNTPVAQNQKKTRLYDNNPPSIQIHNGIVQNNVPPKVNSDATTQNNAVDSILRNHLTKMTNKRLSDQNISNMQVTIDEDDIPLAVISEVKSVTAAVDSDVEIVPEVLPSVHKEPTPKSGKTDWEDKIPMDIISFVDSVTDAEMMILPH